LRRKLRIAKFNLLAALSHGTHGGSIVTSAAEPTEVSDLTGQVATGNVDAHAAKTASGPSRDETASEKLLALTKNSLDQDGAEDILDIALAGKSTVADYMVVATGRSTRHVAALAENLIDRLKHEAGVATRVEGKEAADWVLIDAGDVIVHIFRPEVREFYQLEKMWQTTPDAAASGN